MTAKTEPTNEQDIHPGRFPAAAPEAPTLRRSGRTRWLPRIILIGYVVFLVVFARATYQHGPIVELDDVLHPRAFLTGIIAAGVLAGVKFLVLGALTAVAFGPPTTSARSFGVVGWWLLMFLGGAGMLVLISVAGTGRWPHAVTALVPMIGYVVGAWIGATCLRGFRATLWLIPKLALVSLVMGAVSLGFVFLAIAPEPLTIPTPRVTSAEKRRLVDVLRHRRRAGEGLSRLSLTERDVNLLMTMGLAQTMPRATGRIALGEGTVEGDFSMPVDDRSASGRYLNVQALCRAEMRDGQLEMRLKRCRVGRVAIPRMLLGSVSRLLVSSILDDPDIEAVVGAIDSVRVEPGRVEATIRSGALDDAVIPSLVSRVGQKQDVSVRTRVYYRHLVSHAEGLSDDDRFRGFLRSAFELARQRSQDEDPVEENRGAILALAILLGHYRVESLVGPVTDKDLRRLARQHVGRVTLRGRRDWSRHFLVSAALAVLSTESLSDEAGLFKEELDAGKGGSGFSFSDLAADRAGTLWALAATDGQAAARRMQDRMAAPFEIGEVFPPAADLPEGIPDEELQADYGGVGGTRYREIIAEIERRLATCGALGPAGSPDSR